MVSKSYYQPGRGVPQTDPERRIGTNKYTVNKAPKGVRISRPVLVLLMAGIVLLLVGAVLTTFFLVPRCTDALQEQKAPGQLQTAHIGHIRQHHHARPKQNWDERLPRALRPTHYRLKLMPFIFPDNFTTAGEVSITVNCTEDTDKIIININDIEINEKSFRVTEIKKGSTLDIPTKEFMYETEKQRLTIGVNDLMLAGNQYEIFVKFTGRLNDLLQGFYRITYFDSKSNTHKWMAATQFSPTDARRAFPCFDEPSMKARFTISLARNASMTTRSNMEIKETASIPDMPGWLWDHYHTTPTMSTYLVAMMVSQLQPFKYNTPNNLKLTIWSRPEALQQTTYAGLIGPKVLSYFEDYFQIKFPLPKLDLVALPDFGFNAMENWGLITFREASLLFNPDSSPVKNKRQIATVLSHELGHQWFGNLVTPEWWEDLWLKEGFATYTEYLGVNKVQPRWNIMDEMILSEIHASFKIDQLRSSHPIHVTVNTTEHIRQIFDPISYSKGASIIRMINHFLGEYTFKTGLINFLHQKKYSNANHDDLWKALTSQAHIDGTLDKNMTIKEIMDTWILQSGFPVVNVTRDYARRTATLNQHRFLLSGEVDEESTWWIPVSYTTKGESNFAATTPNIWMNKREIELDLPGTLDEDWIYVNLNNSGYYRVNYDLTNWQLIGADFNNFPPVARAQLIDDAFNLARAGYLDYQVPMNLVIAMFGDAYQPYVPLESTFDGLEYLDNMLATTSTYGNFKIFLAKIMDRVFKGVGFVENSEDTYDVQMKRPSILKWACRLESSDCTIQARRLFRNWMAEEHGHNPITPNLKQVVYCTAIREGGEPEWEFAFDQFQQSKSAAEQSVLLKALGCASEPWLLSRYLKLILSEDRKYPQIRKQDGSAVFQNVANNIIGYQLAFDFLRDNWNKLNEYYGPAFSAISKMVGVLPTYMNTEYQLEQLESFREENVNNLVTSERAMDQAIEKVKANVNWMKYSHDRIDKWLDETINMYRFKK